MDIKCRKTSCRFNKGLSCTASFVEIGQATKCQSFVRGGDEFDFSRRMFETAPEFGSSRNIKQVNLKCESTDCLFNKECRCNANGITVLDEQNKPQCGTFIKQE